MALSANRSQFTARHESAIALILKTSSVAYVGALLMFDAATGAAVTPYDGTIGNKLAGWVLGQQPPVVGSSVITGNSSATPPVLVSVAKGGDFTLQGVAITGLSAATDQGKNVYATDDGTFTLTDPTTHRVLAGYVGKYRSSGVGDLVTANVFGVLGA